MRFALLLVLVFLSSCTSIPQTKCTKCPQVKSKYTSVGQFKNITNNSKDKLYLIFAADWCKPCVYLFDRINEAGIEHGIIFLNIDKTWAFILSKNLGINSVPALAVIKDKSLLLVKHDLNEALVYLLAHVEPK